MEKNKRINYWLGADDMIKLDGQSQAAEMSRSDYIRKLIAEAEVLPTPQVDYLAYADEFRRLGQQFNEYVKEFNETGNFNLHGADKVWLLIYETAERLRLELMNKTVKLEVESHHEPT
ncbi:MAG: hypothetical protein IKZ47_02010 [Clostridia bacterium]|nr:hypothetical protein [Clostridia bacterium]